MLKGDNITVMQRRTIDFLVNSTDLNTIFLCYFMSHKLWTLPIIYAIWDTFYSIAAVEGRSMQPTLNPDTNLQWPDIVILQKRYSNLKEGDIIAFWQPCSQEKRLLIKRIKGISGNWNGHVIPESHVWVEGDESFHSIDSRKFGPVPSSLIVAKISFIIFPFHRFGLL
jgi:inner membrane protease subunit 2